MVEVKNIMSKKAVIITTLAVFIILPIMFNHIYFNVDKKAQSMDPKVSDSEFLNPGEEHLEYLGYLSSGDSVYWDATSFSQDLEVRIATYDDYWNDYPDSGSYEVISNGAFTSGNWYPEYSDSYYIIYINRGSSSEILYNEEIINYSYDNYRDNWISLAMMTITVISIIVGMIFLIFIIVTVSNRVRQKNYKTSYNSPYYQQNIPPQDFNTTYQRTRTLPDQKSDPPEKIAYFCPYCGDKTTSDATICSKCGSKL